MLQNVYYSNILTQAITSKFEANDKGLLWSKSDYRRTLVQKDNYNRIPIQYLVLYDHNMQYSHLLMLFAKKKEKKVDQQSEDIFINRFHIKNKEQIIQIQRYIQRESVFLKLVPTMAQ